MSDVTPIGRVTAALDAKDCGPVRNGTARCPAHEDSHASLSVSVGDDARVLLKCFVGCSIEDITAALGITTADLFVQKGKKARSEPEGGLTVTEYAGAKKLPESMLHDLGIRSFRCSQFVAIAIPYFREDGSDGPMRYRLRLEKRKDGDGRFRWRGGSKVMLYGAWRISDAREAGYVVLVEGESDAQTLWHHGVPALGIPGADTWREEWVPLLDGVEKVYVNVEPDKGGETIRKTMMASSMRDRIWFLNLGEHKDPSGLHCADPDGFELAFRAALERAESAAELVQEEQDTAAAAAWSACEALAKADSILDMLVVDMRKLGAVGEEVAAKLVFLSMVSRCFPRPVSVVVKGPSSAGKSFTTVTVLLFFPDSAQYKLSGMSEKFLLYDTTPLARRMMVFAEADGFSGDFQSYIVRTLLSEGRLIYGTVEKGEGGELAPHMLEREGPTGAIITTTAVKLHPENETRLLSIPVNDTADQTAAVMKAIATGTILGDVDFTRWHALAEWLDSPPHDVEVPFATALAKLIPPVAVRLRRDFGQLLALIRAHALLHRATREQVNGAIVATIDDYRVVRTLAKEILGEAAGRTVPETMRQTVAAVAKLLAAGKTHVSITEIGNAIGVDKASASRRVRAATAAGFLENTETTKKGVKAKIVLGDPMPEERELLPTPEQVLRCCGVQPEESEEDIPSRDPDPEGDETAEEWLF